MRVTAIVVNYRTAELTLAAARSVAAEAEVAQVLVVDNASGDGSAGVLRDGLASVRGAELIESAVNGGFGAGVNLAADRASQPLLFLLNSDATVVAGSMARLAAVLEADPDAAVVAPAVYEADGRTLQADAIGSFPRPFDRDWASSDPAAEAAPDWVSGVAMLVRASYFAAVGGFDPDLTMYLEDVDLCRRLRAAGRTVVREPAAGVVHLGGRSWTSAAEQHARLHESKLVYFRKTGANAVELAYLRATGGIWRMAAALARARRAPRPT